VAFFCALNFATNAQDQRQTLSIKKFFGRSPLNDVQVFNSHSKGLSEKVAKGS